MDALKSEISRFSSVFIVVDALNELPGDVNWKTQDFIENLESLCSEVNLMFTWRNTDYMAINVPSAEKKQMEIKGATEEIETYVRGRLGSGITKDPDVSKKIKRDSILSQRIFDKVVGNSQEL